MNHKFKVGDEVECIDTVDVENHLVKGATYKVIGTSKGHVQVKTKTNSYSFYNHRFKKKEQSMDSLEELVKKANEGWKVLNKLNGNPQIEYKSTGRHNREEWVPLASFDNLVTFRIKPKPQMAPFKLRDSGHEVYLSSDSKTLSIGCVVTTPESTKKVFTALSNGESAQVLAGANLILSPTRKHVECNKGSITWADVDQLLLELNKIEGDNV